MKNDEVKAVVKSYYDEKIKKKRNEKAALTREIKLEKAYLVELEECSQSQPGNKFFYWHGETKSIYSIEVQRRRVLALIARRKAMDSINPKTPTK